MLEFLTQLLDQISRFALEPLAILVIVSAALLILLNRPQVVLLILLIQYILLALLVGPRVYGPLVLLRAGLGFAIYLILLVSVNNLKNSLRIYAWQPATPARWIYRICMIAIGGLAAFGLWRANILHLDNYIGWASYALVCLGFIMAATSTNPLRLGLGILVGMNGIEIASAFMQRGLLVLGMWGVVDVLLALVISTGIENWISGQEVSEP